MAEIKIYQERLTEEIAKQLVLQCPFGVMYYEDKKLKIDAERCKMCGICVKKGDGALEIIKRKERAAIDKDTWRGITIYAEQSGGKLHGVVLELLSKARELAEVTGHPIYALLIGSQVYKTAQTLIQYGADVVYSYDYEELCEFHVDSYTNVIEDFIRKIKPSSFLVGATAQGRSLAPRAAARFATGLTADCTKLEMKENTDLIQIRPAFGGNIMAEIVTPYTRPQFCTVRYKVFEARSPENVAEGTIEQMEISADKRISRIEVLKVQDKPKEVDISEAEVIVAVGKGVKSKADLEMIRKLADRIGAQLACTRPLVECGWFSPKKQIGLSGRTVKAKVILTAGISGSVQFAAGMKGCDCIIAINKDEKAPVFDIANYGFVGDLYEIIPELLGKIGEVATDVS